MPIVEPLTPLMATPEPYHGGAFYEFHRHGPEFQAGQGRQSPRRRPRRVLVANQKVARQPVHVDDGVHGELDLYA